MWRPDRLAVGLVAFGLALGVGAHALDELRGRPLGTRIGDRTLWTIGVLSIGAACAIGVAAALVWWPWLLAFVAFGGFIVVAYNLELFGGRFHTDLWFALAWGAFPLLTAYAAAAERIAWPGLAGAAFAALLSHVQRLLSTPVRMARRHVVDVVGEVRLDDGRTLPVTRELLTAPAESALRALAVGVVALAVTLAFLRA